MNSYDDDDDELRPEIDDSPGQYRSRKSAAGDRDEGSGDNYSQMIKEYVDNSRASASYNNDSFYGDSFGSKPPSSRKLSSTEAESKTKKASSNVKSKVKDSNDDSFPQLDLDFNSLPESKLKHLKEKESSDATTYLVNKYKTTNNKNPYANPFNEEVLKAGNVSIGASQARLYGIEITDDGKVIFPNQHTNKITAEDKDQQMKTAHFLSKPNPNNTLSATKNQTGDHYLDDELNEEKQRIEKHKKKAMQAMKNPRCGYDFVDRLNDRGDLLNRLANANSGGKDDGNSGVSKAAKDVMEQDYNVKLDKLACPKCKKTQTFDEFYEKKRFCSLCNERFTKLVICNVNSFEKRMQQHQQKKEEKLNTLDATLYGTIGKTKNQILKGETSITATSDNLSANGGMNIKKKSIRLNDNNGSLSARNSTTGLDPKPPKSVQTTKDKYRALQSIQKEVQAQSEAIAQFNEKAYDSSTSPRSLQAAIKSCIKRPDSSATSSNIKNNFSKTAPAVNNKKSSDFSNSNTKNRKNGGGSADGEEIYNKTHSDRAMSERFQKLLVE